MTIKFEELFIATLGMFKLEPATTLGFEVGVINNLFKKVIDAELACQRIFDQAKPPSKYEEEGLPVL